MKPHRTAKYYYLKFLRLQGDPHSLAMGVAIGLFVGITPTIPLHSALIIILAWPLRGNILAAFIAATAISNPLTWLPQYYFSWIIGNWLLPGHLSWNRIQSLLCMRLLGSCLSAGSCWQSRLPAPDISFPSNSSALSARRDWKNTFLNEPHGQLSSHKKNPDRPPTGPQ